MSDDMKIISSNIMGHLVTLLGRPSRFVCDLSKCSITSFCVSCYFEVFIRPTQCNGVLPCEG